MLYLLISLRYVNIDVLTYAYLLLLKQKIKIKSAIHTNLENNLDDNQVI